MEYIIPVCIFAVTFVVICVFYDCILRTRMERRMLETWEFIDNMKDFREPENAGIKYGIDP